MIPRFSPRVLFSCDPKGGYVSWDDHKAALAARDEVIKQLVGHYCMTGKLLTGCPTCNKALKLIGSEQGTNQGEE